MKTNIFCPKCSELGSTEEMQSIFTNDDVFPEFLGVMCPKCGWFIYKECDRDL